MAKSSIKAGDTVKVTIPQGEDTQVVMKYDDEIMVVSEVKNVVANKSQYRYAELEGAVSAKGFPYAFALEWLSVIDG